MSCRSIQMIWELGSLVSSRQCLGYYLWYGIYPLCGFWKGRQQMYFLYLSLNLAVKRNNFVSMDMGGSVEPSLIVLIKKWGGND